MPGRHGTAALKLGVELGAEQDSDIGDPHPDQEDDDTGEAAVDLAVRQDQAARGCQGG